MTDEKIKPIYRQKRRVNEENITKKKEERKSFDDLSLMLVMLGQKPVRNLAKKKYTRHK